MACLLGHKWDGCKCEKCGKTRESNHSWNEVNTCYKICIVCNEAVIEHKWKGKNKDKTCSDCGVHGFVFNKTGDFVPDDPTMILHCLVRRAIKEFGDSAFEFPYIYRSLASRITMRDLVLDAHEVVGIHGLLVGYYAALSQKASPIAGGLLAGKTANADSLLNMEVVYKLRHNVESWIITLQSVLGLGNATDMVRSREIMQANTPQVKEKFGMYIHTK